MIGMFASSKAGHDKDIVYIIVGEDKSYVYLVDGEYRKLENPKRKNKKHIQPILKYSNNIVKEKLINKQPIYNEEIKKAIGGIVCQNLT